MADIGGSTGRGLLDRVGFAAAIAVVAGPTLAWLRLLPAMTGFALYTVGGLVAVAMAISALIQSARGRAFGTGRSLALLAAMVFVITAAAAGRSPGVNDFSTDLDDPPSFVAALPLQSGGRDMSYPAAFAVIQRSCCADLRPARLAMPPDRALAHCRATAERMPDWEVVAVDEGAKTLEAVATTRIFGFHDDVVIRVRPDADGSRVDVRSKSREGRGDLGANAERIRSFVTAVEATR